MISLITSSPTAPWPIVLVYQTLCRPVSSRLKGSKMNENFLLCCVKLKWNLKSTQMYTCTSFDHFHCTFCFCVVDDLTCTFRPLFVPQVIREHSGGCPWILHYVNWRKNIGRRYTINLSYLTHKLQLCLNIIKQKVIRNVKKVKNWGCHLKTRGSCVVHLSFCFEET